MKTLTFVGALVLSFILGGVTTQLVFGRPVVPNLSAATISPYELQRAAPPLPETVVESLF